MDPEAVRRLPHIRDHLLVNGLDRWVGVFDALILDWEQLTREQDAMVEEGVAPLIDTLREENARLACAAAGLKQCCEEWRAEVARLEGLILDVTRQGFQHALIEAEAERIRGEKP